MKKHLETFRHCAGISVEIGTSHKLARVAYVIRYKGGEIARGDDFSLKPIYDPYGCHAVAELVEQVFEDLWKRKKILKKDQAYKAAQHLVEDWHCTWRDLWQSK